MPGIFFEFEAKIVRNNQKNTFFCVLAKVLGTELSKHGQTIAMKPVANDQNDFN